DAADGATSDGDDGGSTDAADSTTPDAADSAASDAADSATPDAADSAAPDAADSATPDAADSAAPAAADSAAPDAADGASTDAAGCEAPNAANLVPNAGLDSDVTGWYAPFNIAESWNANDVLGCATSGSIAVTNENVAGINSGVSQCVTVSAGT